MDVRIAETGDVEAVARIHAVDEGVDIEAGRRREERRLSSPDSLILVAELSGAVAAHGRSVRLATEGCPTGWYLSGLVVTPEHRRRRIGRALTVARLELIAERAGEAFYVADASDRATVDLHAAFRLPGADAGVLPPRRHLRGRHRDPVPERPPLIPLSRCRTRSPPGPA